MRSRSLHWPLWSGLLLAVVAFISYPMFFAQFPLTRDVPWVNYLLLAVAVFLAFIAVRRAFAADSTRRRKIIASVVGVLTVLVVAFFVLSFVIYPRQMPTSAASPRVGQRAPDFRLPDANNQQVALSELLAQPLNGRPPKGVLLVFYRGYW